MNDRLQIAAMAMQTLLKRAKKPFTFQEIAHDALGYADALIAAAGEGKPKPQEQYTPWRKCDYCCGSGAIILEGESTTCTKCFGAKGWYVVKEPISLPSEDEIFLALLPEKSNLCQFKSFRLLAKHLHNWLTEREAKQ